MVIAAYSGTGKTTFCQRINDANDFVCMPYKYYLPKGEVTYEEAEKLKAVHDYKMHRDWPKNYCQAVINQYHINRYVVIPPIISVLDALKQEGIPYILCYPEREAKKEYERRFKARGNEEGFQDVFIGNWDYFMDSYERDNAKHRIIMNKDVYLTDILPQIDEIIDEKETFMSINIDDDLMEKLNENYLNTGESPQAFARRALVYIANNDKRIKKI